MLCQTPLVCRQMLRNNPPPRLKTQVPNHQTELRPVWERPTHSGRWLCGPLVGISSLELLFQLFTYDEQILRSLNSQPHSATGNTHDRDGDLVPDQYSLPDFPT